MKRYQFLTREHIFDALNKLRAALLAAKDGNEVEEIMYILTYDERMKIGRRIKIAQLLSQGKTIAQIRQELKVGIATVNQVSRILSEHPLSFELINAREERVEKEFKGRTYQRTGGGKLVYKRTIYTGFKRRDVKR